MLRRTLNLVKQHKQVWNAATTALIKQKAAPLFVTQKRYMSALAQAKQIVTREEEKLFHREQVILSDLLQVIKQLDVNKEDQVLLEQSIKHLQEIFLIVVVGEFNAGKSSFINALLGDTYLKSGITPTTTTLHIIRYGGNPREEFDAHQNIVNIELPLAWLKGLSVVDTPGTNAIIREHQEITEHFVPRSDLILFLTSAERPFSESEYEFLQRIREWGKKVVVIINKYDTIENNKDREEVYTFVRNGIIKLLGFEPQIFTVSSKETLNYKLMTRFPQNMPAEQKQRVEQAEKFVTANDGKKRAWGDLENYILNSLNSTERLKLKLENPLGIADKFCYKYAQLINSKLECLKEDLKTIDIIENQMDLYKTEMSKDFVLHQSKIENLFHDLIHRANTFFDDFVVLSNVMSLLDVKKLEASFNEQVIASFVPEVEQNVSELIDWIIDRRYKQWKAVTDYVHKRAKVSTSEEQLVGSLKSEFNFNRKELLLSIGKTAEDVVKSYDRQADVNKFQAHISSGLKGVFAGSFVGASLGTASVLYMPTLAMTGVGVAGGALTMLGALYLLPYQRNQMKKAFKKNMDQKKKELIQALTEKFNKEMHESMDSIRNAIAPYHRFVKMENTKYETQKANIHEVERAVKNVRDQIHILFQPKEQQQQQQAQQQSAAAPKEAKL